MAYRFETASGLRFYACAMRLRMGETASIRFLDPFDLPQFAVIELLFETKILAKHCRLNNRFFHTCLKRFEITPRSLFLHYVDAENIAMPNTYILRDSKVYDILSRPEQLF